MSKEELVALKSELNKKYEDVKALGLSLDMSRGKPGKEQLDLSIDMLGVMTTAEECIGEKEEREENRKNRFFHLNDDDTSEFGSEDYQYNIYDKQYQIHLYIFSNNYIFVVLVLLLVPLHYLRIILLNLS